MKKIATVLKNWHSDFIPKYSFDYFLQRCQALGNQKLLSVFLSLPRLTCRKYVEYIRERTHGRIQNNQSPYKVPTIKKIKKIMDLMDIWTMISRF